MMLDFQTALLTKKQFLLSELQTHGLRLVDLSVGVSSRIGGARPSGHKARTGPGTTIMAPADTPAAPHFPHAAAPPGHRRLSVLRGADCVVFAKFLSPPPRMH